MKETMKKFMAKMKNEEYYPQDSFHESSQVGKVEKINNDKWNYVLDKFKTRRSIRKFSSDKVEWKSIYEIIDASLNHPCAGNIQNAHIIVVKNKGVIEEIARAESQQYWIADAPYLLVVVRSDSKLDELYPMQGKIYSIQNSASLIQNILMLAHFHNLGACWVESCDNQVLCNILKIPQGEFVDAVIPIGYPLEEPEVQKKDCSRCMFFEEYGNRKRN
jgi:nitroreductase